MRCCDGLPQQVWHHTSVLARRPLTVLLNTSTMKSGLMTSSTMSRAASRWICGSSIWITGQPASASSCSSSLQRVADRDDARRGRPCSGGRATAKAISSGVMVPNLTGCVVRRCAAFHIAAYCRSPRPTGPTIARHHARFEIVVQDVAAAGNQIRPCPGSRRRARVVAVESAHVARRIAGPALAADVVVEAAVAVGEDVEAGDLLLAQVDRERVDVLLAVARIDHRVQERCAMPRFSVYQLGRGSEPMMVVGSLMSAVARSMRVLPVTIAVGAGAGAAYDAAGAPAMPAYCSRLCAGG